VWNLLVEGLVAAAVAMVMRFAVWFRNATSGARLLLAFVGAAAALAGVRGFAASFGTGSGGLGAGNGLVASCGSGMTFGYRWVFDADTGGYAVNGIKLWNIPAGCLGRSLSVTFYESSRSAMGSPVSMTLPTSGTTEAISISAGSAMIEASRISGISVVVS
jgi:hypothetical protein